MPLISFPIQVKSYRSGESIRQETFLKGFILYYFYKDQTEIPVPLIDAFWYKRTNTAFADFRSGSA